MMPICYLNGEIGPLASARISVLDRGFLFGDGVYEVVPVYAGHLFCWDRHLRRLARSLSEIRISTALDNLAEAVHKLLQETKLSDAVIYIQITRGAENTRRHAFPQPPVAPTVSMMVMPRKPIAAEKIRNGVSCRLSDDYRWLRGDIKSISLLGAVLAAEEAVSNHHEETIFIRQGTLTEASSSNVQIIVDNKIITPLNDYRILPGITGEVMLETANDLGVEILSRDITRAELMAADEIWLTSSTREMLPVVALGGVMIGGGKPGGLFKRVHAALRQRIEEYTK